MTLTEAAGPIEEHPVRREPPPPEVRRGAGATRRRRLVLGGAGLAVAAVAVAGGAVALRSADTEPASSGPAGTVTTTTGPAATPSTAVVDGSDGDLRASLTAPVEAEAGTTVPFHVTAGDPSGKLLALRLDSGDGSAVTTGIADRACAEVAADPTEVDEELVLSYREPGTYTVTLTVVTGDCGATEDEVRVRTTVVVVPWAGASRPATPAPP